MIRPILATASFGLLVACGDGNPFNFDLDGDGTDDIIVDTDTPETISDNLSGFAYDEGAGTLTLALTSLDGTPTETVYGRNLALEAQVPGYLAFSVQDDALDRMFIAVAKEAPDGTSQAVAVADGGQFVRFFGGALYTQIGTYSPDPDGGLVSYAGTYAGVTNIEDSLGGQLITPPGGTDPAILPEQAGLITGSVFINADFTDNTVNGAIYERVIADFAGDVPIPDVFLIPADINGDGGFVGTVENPEQTVVGDYAGTFGGEGATSIAGAIHLEGDFIDDVEFEQEYGIFVLAKCGEPDDDPFCDDFAPP